jgi:secreted PhoX family phosphatase
MDHIDDEIVNESTDTHFTVIAERRMKRRTVLSGGVAAFAGFVAGTRLLGPATAWAETAGSGATALATLITPEGLLGFAAIAASNADEVVVPPGYTARPFIPWGTPILGGFPAFVPGSPPFVPRGNTAPDQASQIGMHHDGMHYFPLGDGPEGSSRGLLVVNHEYVDEGYLHTGQNQPSSFLTEGKAAWTIEMIRKSQNAHGVSVVEIERDGDGVWQVVASRLNRRITANTKMSFSGPVRLHRLVQTSSDPVGKRPQGTVNNCAHGYTPWGTYLACEENFNGYFRLDDAGGFTAEQAALNARYGIGGDRQNWATQDPRFVVTPAEPNEPNRFGWVVEIDPNQPASRPVKRSALGRMKHEGAFVHVAGSGQVVAYMGDDQTNEYIYKFVSAESWETMRGRGRSPLDDGTLYVARFNDDGSGQWLPLVQGDAPLDEAGGFADQGDVLVKTRLAASALGATPMDRPEWTTVDPNTGLVYCTLTNNTSSAKVLNPPNPRKPNPWGHIIRWEETGGDHTATTFEWDLFLLAGPGRDSATPDGSTILAEDAFGSPDGLWADDDGRIWIQTDGRQPGGFNDQMLAANPYVDDAAGTPEIKRFFTGVVNGEVTGVITTPDQTTMFVNIQHPGEGGGSTWPQGDGFDTPRSATVVITKDDGGIIGS